MRASSVAIVTLLALTVSACAGQQRRGPPPKVINRVLATAPGAAQPSTIVKTEIAYARAAREQGLFTAGLEYATPGAIQHSRNGGVPFTTLAQSLSDPAIAPQWAPRVVVISCDGALALTKGRFKDPEGFVGNYVTTWVRQPDNTYKWSYDVAGRDDPQPAPPEPIPEGAIVVTAIDSIKGLVASCPERGTRPPPPASDPQASGSAAVQTSSDGTLRWQWEHRGDGTKYVKAQYWYEGGWETAIEESLASPPEE